MKNYYMIFDLEQDRVGISNLNTNSLVFQGNPPTKKQVNTDSPVDNNNSGNNNGGNADGK